MSTDLSFALLIVVAVVLAPALLVWHRRFKGPAWAFAIGGFLRMTVWIAANLVMIATFLRIGLRLWSHGEILSLFFSLFVFAAAAVIAMMLAGTLGGWFFFDRYGPNGDKAWREMLDRGREIRRQTSGKGGA